MQNLPVSRAKAYSLPPNMFQITDSAIARMYPFDPQPIHFSKSAAIAAGFQDRIAHGMLSLAYLAGDVVALANPEQIREIKVRFHNPALINGTIESIIGRFDGTTFSAVAANPKDTERPYATSEFTIGKREVYLPGFNSDITDRIRVHTMIAQMRAIGTNSLHGASFYVREMDAEKIPGPNDDLYSGMATIKPLLHVSGVLGNHFPGPGTVYGSQSAKFMTNLFSEIGLHEPHRIAVLIEPIKSEPTKNPNRSKLTLSTTVWDTSYFGLPSFFPYLIMKGEAVVFARLH